MRPKVNASAAEPCNPEPLGSCTGRSRVFFLSVQRTASGPSFVSVKKCDKECFQLKSVSPFVSCPGSSITELQLRLCSFLWNMETVRITQEFNCDSDLCCRTSDANMSEHMMEAQHRAAAAESAGEGEQSSADVRGGDTVHHWEVHHGRLAQCDDPDCVTEELHGDYRQQLVSV